ncbi:MAG: PEGA domain-containing protein [Kofleriaceae bacterium]|nr:PEGA domain-containing protein [Kofleriaceae bacterium]MCL4228395.1 PEGA domain-containing protein [Myxococcales bacterium]
MGARRAWFLAALLVVSVAPAAIAQPEDEVEMDPEDGGPAPDASPAEPDPATKAAAKKLLDGGDGFLKKGDYHKKRKRLPQAQAEFERALAAYQKAYEMVPNPKILFPIASAEERLERWVDAATHYSRFLSQAADVDAKLRAEAERRLEEVKLHIGVLSLAVSPDGAQITLGDRVVGTAPLADPLFLAPGDYTLSITADGHKPLEQAVSIEAGSESERAFELESAAVIIEAPRPPPPPPPVEPVPAGPSKLALYATGGLTLAFLAGATTTGILAVGKHGTFKDDGVGDGAREDARQSGKNLALLTDGLVLGTIVAGGVATYYYLKVYRPRQAEHRRKLKDRESRFDEYARGPKVLVTPWVQGGAGGLVLTAPL